MKAVKEMVSVINSWVYVQGIGKVGLWSSSDKIVLLDYSMQWIVGTNASICCNEDQIEEKIAALFNVKK